MHCNDDLGACSEEDRRGPRPPSDKHRYHQQRRSTVHSLFPVRSLRDIPPLLSHRDHLADPDSPEESCSLDMLLVAPSSPDSGHVDVDGSESVSSSDMSVISSYRWKNTKNSIDELWTEFVDGLKDNRIHHENSEADHRLSASVLGRDVQRCLVESHFYLEFGAGLWDFCTWKAPLASLCLFMVYMNAVWNEILIPLVYLLFLLQLGINYLKTQKNIDIGLNFLPRRKVPSPKFDLNGAQLIFYVVKKAQMLLTFSADALEKLRALFMWRKPEVTLKFVLILSFFFWVHVLTSLNTFLIVIGLLCGGKAFIMTYLYYRFPRLRQMFDIAFFFYRHLPKSPHKLEKMEKKTTALRRQSDTYSSELSQKLKNKLLRNDSTTTNCTVKTCDTSRRGSADLSFSDSCCSSSISIEKTNENLLFEIRRPCSMIDKNQAFPKGLTQGELILNDSMLMFSYKNAKSDLTETIEIPFDQLVMFKKVIFLIQFSSSWSVSLKRLVAYSPEEVKGSNCN
uniref:GRAM domain-containing protein 4 n=1 Tax=Bursaphelenchus xylophilus TaxID=6326 RepID=A0A1I7RH54_BURXY